MFARELIYSMIEEECGIHCGKVQTIMLRLPGNKSNTPAGWGVHAKLTIYLWLGAVSNKQFSYSGLPKGFDLSPELRNAERPGALAPSNVHYLEKHVSFFSLHFSTFFFVVIINKISTNLNPLMWYNRHFSFGHTFIKQDL